MKHLKTFTIFESKKINQKDYKFYVFHIDTKKIAEGFEYENDAKDRIKEIIEESSDEGTENSPLKGKLKSYTKKYLLSKNIDPYDNSNWGDAKW